MTRILLIVSLVLLVGLMATGYLYSSKCKEIEEIQRRSEYAKKQYDSLQRQFDDQNTRITADFNQKKHKLDSISGLQKKQLENYLSLSGKKARIYIDSGNALREELDETEAKDTAEVRRLKSRIERIDRITMGYTCIDVQIPREIMAAVGGK